MKGMLYVVYVLISCVGQQSANYSVTFAQHACQHWFSMPHYLQDWDKLERSLKGLNTTLAWLQEAIVTLGMLNFA